MKILFYVIGFIAFCFLGFYAIGLFAPVINYETTLEVKRSPEQSWNVFTNKDLLADWMEGFQSIETIKGEPLTQGSVFMIKVTESGNTYSIKEEVLNVVPNQEYTILMDNEVLTNKVQLIFSEPAPYTTLITSKNEVKAKNWFLRSLFVFMKSSFKKLDDQNLQNLKNLIESDPILTPKTK